MRLGCAELGSNPMGKEGGRYEACGHVARFLRGGRIHPSPSYDKLNAIGFASANAGLLWAASAPRRITALGLLHHPKWRSYMARPLTFPSPLTDVDISSTPGRRSRDRLRDCPHR